MGGKKAMFGSIDDLFIYFPTLKFHYDNYRDTDGWNAWSFGRKPDYRIPQHGGPEKGKKDRR